MTGTLRRRVGLAHGGPVPQLGLGVFQVPGERTQALVEEALAVGYRHFDTATAYCNEKAVGAALRGTGIPRAEIFVTSKLRNGDQGYESSLRAYENSCRSLGLEYLDLYLIHWPNPAAGLWQPSWTALERLHQEGRVRAIGVSNFLVEHLVQLEKFADTLPSVNQIELHPTYQQRTVKEACAERGIAIEAYSPLGQGADLMHPEIRRISAQRGGTPAQVILAWHIAKGHIVIPKSVQPHRLKENSELGAIALSPEDVLAIDRMDTGLRVGGDPRTFSLSQIR